MIPLSHSNWRNCSFSSASLLITLYPMHSVLKPRETFWFRLVITRLLWSAWMLLGKSFYAWEMRGTGLARASVGSLLAPLWVLSKRHYKRLLVHATCFYVRVSTIGFVSSIIIQLGSTCM